MEQSRPHVGLFIPCYVDQFYPQVGIATLEILEKLNCNVSYPLDQTCCGQPLANSGYERETKESCQQFLNSFLQFDYVVAPTGSCVHHIKERYSKILNAPELQPSLNSKIFELTEFLLDILKVELQGTFRHKVGYHASCHALRGLRLSKSSEVNTAPFDKVKSLFGKVEGLEWSQLQRNDELSSVDSTDTTNYDSAETEDQTIDQNNTDNLPNEYVPPNTTGTTQLNTTLGTEPPPSIQDQTNLNTYTP
mgnify:CR=1 FL=1